MGAFVVNAIDGRRRLCGCALRRGVMSDQPPAAVEIVAAIAVGEEAVMADAVSAALVSDAVRSNP